MESLINHNWHKHQQDPDNWLRIPEFHVLPQDVDFRGFKYPIFGPKVSPGLFVLPIWDMVKAVRSQAKKRFKSLVDLKAANSSLIERCGIFDKDFTTEKHSDDEVFAYRYESVFYNLERCLNSFKNDKNQSITTLARAAADIAGMMIEKPIDNDTIRDIRSGIGRSGALRKLATDPKQADKVLVRERWDDWQEKPYLYKGKAEFARDMLSRFKKLESAAVITRWCLMWQKENGTQQA